MRALLSIIVIACCAGCAHTKSAFVQDGIRIVPPVTQEGYDKATETIAMTVFNDGGTRWFKITDAEGTKFDVYVDRRLFPNGSGGFSSTNGVYLMAYPGHSNSVRVVDTQDFRKKIGDFK